MLVGKGVNMENNKYFIDGVKSVCNTNKNYDKALEECLTGYEPEIGYRITIGNPGYLPSVEIVPITDNHANVLVCTEDQYKEIDKYEHICHVDSTHSTYGYDVRDGFDLDKRSIHVVLLI